jgi:16S rRNA (cytosine1402-N4)-methyltransferase
MNNSSGAYHIPVLLDESVSGLNICDNGVYVDLTYGGGGHSCEILSRLGTGGKLYGFDQDSDAEANIPTATGDGRVVFVRSNFRYLSNFMRLYNARGKVDGILADLGVSSHHFDDGDRGFSFRLGGKLDMRMNVRSERTASDIVNEYPEEKLADIFYMYGELRQSRALASAIIRARQRKRIDTLEDLMTVTSTFSGRDKENKFMAQLCQALRIEVNDEMSALKDMLSQTEKVLRPGGRLVVITYHSLEDRIVKNFIKTRRFDGVAEKDFYGNINTPFRQINNKVITPSPAEVENNPRSRSAKLRIAELLKRD